ncbi:MAG: hypothetical protein II291_05065 [Succinivibrio sp.]|nr:hypothetical protein [Succinivibrio sp.]
MKNKKPNFIKDNYEKVILGAVLIALISSLVILIGKNKNSDEDNKDFSRSLLKQKPANPNAEKASDEFYLAAQESAKSPVILSTGDDAPNMLIAPSRVYCVKEDCKKPIKFEAKLCPFCNEPQPDDDVAEDWDSDGDGMPDNYEREHSFNPADIADKDLDADNDGFTNYEEFVAKTNPRDASVHPPLIDFLVVQDVKSIQFPYELKGKVGFNDNIKFQINGPSGKSSMVAVGNELEKTGYKLTKYEQKDVVIKRKGLPDKKGQVYVITLSNQHKEIQLQQGGGKVFSEREVFFVCTKDPEQKVYQAKEFESFSFDNVEYQVKSVDKNGNSVVILDKSNQQSRTVTR